jgi:flagellar protein FlaF
MLQDRVASYERVGGASASPRDNEITAFAVVNRMLGEAAGEESGGRRRLKALGKNHELWSLLVKDLACGGNALPDSLKRQLVSLGMWSMGYSLKAMGAPLAVEPLIAVNRNIAEGLRAQAVAPAAAPPPAGTAPRSLNTSF